MSRFTSRSGAEALALVDVDQNARVGALARRLAAIVTSHVLDAVHEHDERIRGAHLRVLTTISAGSARAIDVANRLGTTKQTVSPVVEDLVAWGYLSRTPDPADRRAKLLTFSAAGLALGQIALEAAETLERRFQDAVGSDALAQCRKTLSLLINTAQEEPQQPPG